MRFVDFLRSTVLLSAAAATALAAVTVIAADNRGEPRPALISMGWWVITAVVGLFLGRRAAAAPAIARLLAERQGDDDDAGAPPGPHARQPPVAAAAADARDRRACLPAAAGPGIAAGVPIVLALYWRRQDAAVAAIEDRDGVRFYVRRTSPLRPMALERAPGFKALRPEGLRRRTRMTRGGTAKVLVVSLGATAGPARGRRAARRRRCAAAALQVRVARRASPRGSCARSR